jgi:hypothetical protein
VQVWAGFDMDSQDISPGRGEIAQVPIRLTDHQVHIDDSLIASGDWPYRVDDERPNCNVGNEVPIHYIDMNILGTSGQSLLYLIAEASEVSRENRWS